MRSPALIEEVKVYGSRLVVRPNPNALGGVIKEPFWVEYDPGVEVSEWPITLQTAPFVLNIAPIVWATGADVQIGEMDSSLADSLERIRNHFRTALYPGLAWDGTLSAEKISSAKISNATPEIGVLFSGGLDSVTTSMRQLDYPQRLITVMGADVALDDDLGWSYVVDQVRGFAELYGHSVSLIRSNLRTFYDSWTVNHFHPTIPDWWSNVQHGMGLAGLAAPLAQGKGIEHLYIASSHTASFSVPWGSSPKIDESIEFAGLGVVHDGFELSRQDKLREVFRIASDKGVAMPPLRVCYANPNGGGSNCGKCEKCLRTVAGAVLEGGELQKLGFPAPVESYLQRIPRKFRLHQMPSTENVVWMWQDIQERAAVLQDSALPQFAPEVREFIAWLSRFSFDAYNRRYARVKRFRKAAQRLLRRNTKLFEFARRVAIRLEDR